MTNSQKIRAMSDEELATRIAAKIVCMNCPAASSVCAEICCGGKTCRKIILDWLKQEVKDNA